MNWETKKDLRVRVVRRFALFPYSLDNGRTVWLEWVYKKQKYRLVFTTSHAYMVWVTLNAWQ